MNRFFKLQLGFLIIVLLLGGACRNRSSQRVESSNPVLPSIPVRTTAVQSFADVVDKVAPAVITIRSERRVRPARPFPFFNDPLFRDFFGFNNRQNRPQLERGIGSGVIITKDGYIITNHHVIDGADDIKVELSPGKIEDAKVIGSDPPSDIAVLKISTDNLTILSLGDSDKVRVGDVVLAIGNPLGVGQTVTAGIISAKERTTGVGQGTYESFLQTDAPINRGNSGGALINTAGELIGINSQILSPGGEAGGNIGIGFAIPSNMARQVAEQLIKKGKVRRSRMGVGIQTLDKVIAESLNIDDTKGIIINSVEPGSPADHAGIKQGDVITELNGQKVEDTNQFRNQVASNEPGTEITLTIIRNKQRQQVRVKLQELSASNESQSQDQSEEQSSEQIRLGMNIMQITPEIAAQLGLNKNAQGLVVTDVDPTGVAARSEIREGDVITQVNMQSVRTLQDFRDALARLGNRRLTFTIRRQGSSFFVPIQ
jgi:serine protease Do